MKKWISTIAIIAIIIGVELSQANVNRAFIASWYNENGVMANGKLFDPTNYTCATVDYPLHSILRIYSVHDPKNKVVVEVTDRINKRFAGKRIDLSPIAFKRLAPLDKGLVEVNVNMAGR